MSPSDSKLVAAEISESLMTSARSSFHREEFDEMERFLVRHEQKLEMELRNLKRDYEEMTKMCDLLEKENGELEVETLAMMNELKKRRIEYEESRKQLISLETEKYRMVEELMRGRCEAEEMVALRDSQLIDFDTRVFNLEEAFARIMRVPVMIIRSGAFLTGERMGLQVPANGVNFPVYEGQNGGINIENLQNGAVNHVGGENGGFGPKNLQESGGNFEHGQNLESFLNSLPQFARNSTGTQGSDFPIQAMQTAETAADVHDTAEASSGAKSTFNCPQVESVTSDQEKVKDESPDTDGGR